MRNHRVLHVLFVSLVLAFPLLGCSNSLPGGYSHNIGAHSEIFIDRSGSLSAKELATSRRFKRSTATHPNFGFVSGVVWLRFSLRPPTSGAYRLDVAREWIDSAILYQVQLGVPQELYRSGTQLAVQDRPVQTARIIFPLALQSTSPSHFLLRLQSRSAISFQGTVMDTRVFARENTREHLLFGGFIALMLGLAAYSLLLFIMLRDRIQLYVSLLLASYAAAETTSHGYSSWLLRTSGGWLELQGGAFCFAAFVVLLLAMSREVSQSTSRWWLLLSAIVCLPSFVAVAVPQWHFLVFLSLSASVGLVLIVIVNAIRKGIRHASTFLAALSALLIPGTITLGALFGILPTFAIIEYANHVGAVAMSVMFSLIVAGAIRFDRNDIRKLNAALEERLVQLELATNEVHRVNEDLRRDRRAIQALNQELEVRLKQLDIASKQVQHTNQELRFQVSARSHALVDLLSRHEGNVSCASLTNGELFDSRYKIIEVLGTGGWGLVYRVTRVSDNKMFALKVLTRELSGKKAARLAREAEIGARLHHPNLVGFVDVGIASEGAPYVVMELIEGGSLEERSEQFGDIDWILPLMRDAAEGLAALHEAHVVHRDIKPGNILIDVSKGYEVARIADFGISLPNVMTPNDTTMEQEESALLQPERLTQAGALLGTPAYMAPELVRLQNDTNPASDIFSFGVLLFECLTGRTPFALLPLKAILAGIPLPIAEPLDVVHPLIDRSLRAIIEATLSYDPQHRPTSRALAQALHQAVPPSTRQRSSPTADITHIRDVTQDNTQQTAKTTL